MRDLWNWWKARQARIFTVLLLGIILAWMSMGLWQAQRLSGAIVREVRGSFQRQESARKEQFGRLLATVEEYLARQDADMMARREEHKHLLEMLDQLLEKMGKQVTR